MWLERQQHLKERPASATRCRSLRLFKPDLIWTTVHTSLLMGAFLFMYHSITYWYPTLITQMHRPTLPFLAALNIGGITGAIAFGRLSEGRARAPRLGDDRHAHRHPRRSRCTSSRRTPALLLVGALAMGFFGAGNFGVVPGYLTERFPTVARAVGAGFAYHVGAGLGSFTPTLVGMLQDRGLPLPTAMAACIAGSGTLVIVLMWLGPETRGRHFTAES